MITFMVRWPDIQTDENDLWAILGFSVWTERRLFWFSWSRAAMVACWNSTRLSQAHVLNRAPF